MTISRFYNAHIVDPSQSIDGTGYIDIADGKISELQLGTPAINDTVDISTDCNKAVLTPGLVDMRVQSADPGAEPGSQRFPGVRAQGLRHLYLRGRLHPAGERADLQGA